MKSKRSKGTPPSSLTKAGAYFRFTNVYFYQMHHYDVTKLGGSPSYAELDCLQFLEKMFLIFFW